ncbi:MAG: hypothetical protein K5920_11560 [Bacteroidales bacterium]|nr:hypothetical protein [Bacteroidales bacterium]
MASNETVGFYDIKAVKDELHFYKKEATELSNTFVHLSYKPSVLKSIVLARHKLNHQEIQAGIDIAKSSYEELLDNFRFFSNVLDQKTKVSSAWAFGEKRLMCFQHESNMLFYGALEGLCSFPKNTLDIYEQQSPRMKFLPIQIGLKKRKADYIQFQEIEAQKAEDLMRTVTDQLLQDEMSIANLASTLFRKELYFFIAGSKALQTERDIFSNVISQLQTKWSSRNIFSYGVSYQNFENKFTLGGQQVEYDEFIQRFADVAVFVLNGDVGGITRREFDLAMDSFKAYKHPTIYVYSKTVETISDGVQQMHDRINEEKQYWQDYLNNNELRLMIHNDLSDYLQKTYEEMIQKQKEVLEQD